MPIVSFSFASIHQMHLHFRLFRFSLSKAHNFYSRVTIPFILVPQFLIKGHGQTALLSDELKFCEFQ